MNENIGSPTGGTYFTNKAVTTGITGQGATTFSCTPAGTAHKMEFVVNGKACNKAAISGGATPTTDAISGLAFTALAANQGCVFVYALNAAGTISAVQGTIVPLDRSGNFVAARSEFPALPDTLAPFCYVVCKNGSTGSAWTFGTSQWIATGMTATPVDVLALPARPQVS